MSRLFPAKTIFLVDTCQNADASQNTSSMASLNIQRRVAHIEDLPHVINSRSLHGVKDHKRRWAAIPDIIAAYICGEHILPAYGAEDKVGDRSKEAGCSSQQNVVRFQPGKRVACPKDRFHSTVGKSAFQVCSKVLISLRDQHLIPGVLTPQIG